MGPFSMRATKMIPQQTIAVNLFLQNNHEGNTFKVLGPISTPSPPSNMTNPVKNGNTLIMKKINHQFSSYQEMLTWLRNVYH